MKKFLFLFVACCAFFCLATVTQAGTLSCSVATTCPSGTVIWRMASTSNSQSELPGQALYTQLVCCTGVAGLSSACSGTFATVLKISATTNAHAEQNTQSNYANSICIQAPAGGSVSVGYQASNCTGFDTTLGSMSATTNAHVGNSSAYTTKICASAVAVQSLTFSISANTVSFGTLDASAARFANTSSGSATEVEAHTLSAATNAFSGYTVTVKGATLTSGANTVTAIGSTNTASTVGAEQFGLRINASGGSGTVTAPYAASGFAYAGTSTTSSQVASSNNGDNVTTIYSVRYIANVAGSTEAGNYATTLNYVATGNF